ncbi:MAG: hypothetical protein JRF33_06985 [Deltaproteobacteria bacterium]|nr:hypothetical protein [Deltaproteobacteria bacterium]
MPKATLLLLLALALFNTPALAASEVLGLLPEGAPKAGIKAAAAADHFVGNKLFDYMNGGAEVFLAYGFKDLGVRTYKAKCGELSVAIYRMGSEADAFGIWSMNAKGTLPKGFTTPAALGPNMLSFFRGAVYARVIAQKASEQANKDMTALGLVVFAKLTGQARIPTETAFLPKGAVKGSLRYLPNAETAKTLWFDGEGDLLLDKGGKAVSATHAGAEFDLQLTRAVYPSAKAATAVCQALAKKLSIKAESKDGLCKAMGKTPDDSFSALQTDGAILRWAGGAGDAKAAKAALTRIRLK